MKYWNEWHPQASEESERTIITKLAEQYSDKGGVEVKGEQETDYLFSGNEDGNAMRYNQRGVWNENSLNEAIGLIN